MTHEQCNNNGGHKHNPELELMDLPIEILIDILLRLPVNSLCCIQCVSKALLNTVDIDNLSFATLHMQRLLSTSCTADAPRLMLVADSPFSGRMMHTLKYDDGCTLTKSNHAITSNFQYSRRLHYYSDFRFVFCNLFFFSDRKYERPCLVNHLKGEVLMLPVPTTTSSANINGGIFTYVYYGMGFDHITNTYKIVRISQYRYNNDYTERYFVAQVLVLGTNSWRQIKSSPPCRLTSKKASAYGDMHWLVTPGRGGGLLRNIRILSFDFKKEEFCWTPHPTLDKKLANFSHFQLLNLRGSLAVLDSSSDEYMEIWGLKNYEKKEWVLSYKIEMQPPFGKMYRSCGEWEHGIHFQGYHLNKIVFLDLTHDSPNTNTVDVQGSECRNMNSMTVISYTNSLISLNKYGDLVQVLEQGTDESPMSKQSCKKMKESYKKMIKDAEASDGRDFLYARDKEKVAQYH